MKELTLNEVKEVSGGFIGPNINTFSRVGSWGNFAFQRGGLFNSYTATLSLISRPIINKIKEDPAAYGRGLTTWPHYIFSPRAF